MGSAPNKVTDLGRTTGSQSAADLRKREAQVASNPLLVRGRLSLPTGVCFLIRTEERRRHLKASRTIAGGRGKPLTACVCCGSTRSGAAPGGGGTTLALPGRTTPVPC